MLVLGTRITAGYQRNSLLLRPHPSFLAKNELKKRFDTREIPTLRGLDGQTSQICPVSAIKRYLEITKESKVRSLFLNPKNRKAISLSLLRHHICSLITEADPDTRAKVHDIRKYAASLTLQQDMLVGDLIKDFNWSTPAMFYKFYFMQTEHPGRPVSPCQDQCNLRKLATTQLSATTGCSQLS